MVGSYILYYILPIIQSQISVGTIYILVACSLFRASDRDETTWLAPKATYSLLSFPCIYILLIEISNHETREYFLRLWITQFVEIKGLICCSLLAVAESIITQFGFINYTNKSIIYK